MSIFSIVEVISRAAMSGIEDATPHVTPTETEHVVQEKSKKEQVFEWLEQRQAYVDDAFNGRVQSMAACVADAIGDLMRQPTPEEQAFIDGPRDFIWSDASQDWVPYNKQDSTGGK